MALKRTTGLAPLAALLLILSFSSVAQAPLQVRAEPVRLAPLIEELPLAGTVVSPRYSEVAPQESGLVQSLAVDAGDRVATGDLLLQLDSELTRLELNRLQARLEESRLLYEEAKRLADEGRRLVGERNISKSEHEARLAGEAAAEQRYRQLGIELQVQQLRLERATLRAPFAGVIGRKMTEVGQWLAAGTPALSLAQVDPLRVQAQVPERYFAEVTAGTRVHITFDAWPGDAVEAEVDSIVAVSDLATRSFLARTDIPNPDGRLAPGMSARLVFALAAGASRAVLQVPADAVVRRPDGSAVVWVLRDDKATMVPVTIGRRSGGNLEVNSTNLAEGEPVVTLGNESLREGQAVTAAEP